MRSSMNCRGGLMKGTLIKRKRRPAAYDASVRCRALEMWVQVPPPALFAEV